MLIFIDTEFTTFYRPTLISIALVGEDGREFYAERDDYPHDDCSYFVLDTVLPLLGRVEGATCNENSLTQRLRAWFEALPEPALIVCDYEADWLLLADAMLGRGQQTPVTNIGEVLILDSVTQSDPVFEQAQELSYTPQWPPHHALADARALCAGYRAWRAADGESP